MAEAYSSTAPVRADLARLAWRRELLRLILVTALLAGTVAAFVVAERLKLQPAPIRTVEVDRVFSPVCDCRSRAATISFMLPRPGRLSLSIVDQNQRVVRRLAENRRFDAGTVRVSWDGSDNLGERVPEGIYRPKVELPDQGRTILMPNPIRLDATAPRLRLASPATQLLSPDGDGRRDRVSFRYRISEKAKVIASIDGRKTLETRFRRQEDKLDWYGQRDGRGLPARLYRVELVASDPAGNLSNVVTHRVRIRYIELARARLFVRARTRFGVRVLADASRFRWRIGRLRAGEAAPGLLVLRAPRAGRYWLYVLARGHSDRARLVVRPR